MINNLNKNTKYFLGNDLVDLSTKGCIGKNKDYRFLERVFTDNERSVITQGQNPDNVLWALWAAKEAAFKAYQKVSADLIFSHHKFYVSNESLSLLSSDKNQQVLGHVCYDGLKIPTFWQWTNNTVHCLSVYTDEGAFFHEWSKIIIDVRQMNVAIAYQKMREALSQKELASIFNDEALISRWYAKKILSELIAQKEIEILRPLITKRGQSYAGPPYLQWHDQKLEQYQLSISHDGNWLAVALFKHLSSTHF